MRVVASIVIPTRGRPDYLVVTLASIADQARECAAEVIVVQDGADPRTEAAARAQGTRLVTLEVASGANAARNAGAHAAAGDLIVFTDDDIEAQPGWLGALVAAAQATPDVGVFGGPIRARLEGGGPRACGREPAPITTLDLGAVDCNADLVWSANMAIRRRALEAAGPFDETIFGRGEEEEWQQRYAATGGHIRYVAGATVVHRRTARDARLRALTRANYALGRTARRNDLRKGSPPRLRLELRVFAGCLWHTVRRRCAIGLVMAAHSLGRLRELASERAR